MGSLSTLSQVSHHGNPPAANEKLERKKFQPPAAAKKPVAYFDSRALPAKKPDDANKTGWQENQIALLILLDLDAKNQMAGKQPRSCVFFAHRALQLNDLRFDNRGKTGGKQECHAQSVYSLRTADAKNQSLRLILQGLAAKKSNGWEARTQWWALGIC